MESKGRRFLALIQDDLITESYTMDSEKLKYWSERYNIMFNQYQLNKLCDFFSRKLGLEVKVLHQERGSVTFHFQVLSKYLDQTLQSIHEEESREDVNDDDIPF